MTEQLFNEITAWQDATFTEATPLSCVNHLSEEVGELKASIEEGNPDREELADCAMLLIAAANKLHMSYADFVESISGKFMICKERKWGKPNGLGYVKHIGHDLGTFSR